MNVVAPDRWLATLTGLHGDGYQYLDVLAGVDRVDEIEVVVHIVDPGRFAHVLVCTRLPASAAVLPTLTGLYPAAGWHEREAAEMLGVTFHGHPDPRPLLRRTSLGRPPLLRSTVLAARAVTPWPGGTDEVAGRPGSRRRQAPPGVPVDWPAGAGS